MPLFHQLSLEHWTSDVCGFTFQSKEVPFHQVRPSICGTCSSIYNIYIMCLLAIIMHKNFNCLSLCFHVLITCIYVSSILNNINHYTTDSVVGKSNLKDLRLKRLADNTIEEYYWMCMKAKL